MVGNKTTYVKLRKAHRIPTLNKNGLQTEEFCNEKGTMIRNTLLKICTQVYLEDTGWRYQEETKYATRMASED